MRTKNVNDGRATDTAQRCTGMNGRSTGHGSTDKGIHIIGGERDEGLPALAWRWKLRA